MLAQTSQPKLDVFQELLGKYPGVFHQARTAKSLLVHWQLLKQYYLLDDQTGGFSQRFMLQLLLLSEKKNIEVETVFQQKY